MNTGTTEEIRDIRETLQFIETDYSKEHYEHLIANAPTWLRSLLEERDKQKELEHTLCLTIEAADKTIQQLREELELKESEYQATITKVNTTSQLARKYQAENTSLRTELEQAKKERDGWRQEAKREREQSERIVEEREEAIIEVEWLCSQLAAKDKVLLDIKYQIEQSNHPAGLGILAAINATINESNPDTATTPLG